MNDMLKPVQKEPLVKISTEICNKTDLYVSEFCEKCYSDKAFVPGTTELIECGTGKGKSYMMIHKILPIAYRNQLKVLIVGNRIKLKDQYHKDVMQGVFEDEFLYNPCVHSLKDHDECLTITTYQRLEWDLSNGLEVTLRKLDEYDIIIADEIHYFLSESTYNAKTCLSAEAILMYLSCKKRYFLSATMENIRPVILNPHLFIEPIYTSKSQYYRLRIQYSHDKTEVYNDFVTYNEYLMPQSYDYIDAYYYKSDEVIIDYIINSESTEKWLYFVSDKTTGRRITEEINKKYREIHTDMQDNDIASFISAEYKNESELKMNEVMKYITDYEDTKTKVIVTTSVLDNGINLKSKELVNIVVNTDNRISFIQMLGRKRVLNANEKVKLYITASKISLFEKRLNRIKDILIDINKIKIEDMEQFMCNVLYKKEDNRADSFRMVLYPMNEVIDRKRKTTFKINQLSIHQLKLLYKEYTRIIQAFNEKGENAYIFEQLSWIGINYDESKWLEDKYIVSVKKNLEKYLSGFIDKELEISELESILDVLAGYFHKKLEKVRSNRISIKKANEGLQSLEVGYRIDKNKIYRIDLIEENK